MIRLLIPITFLVASFTVLPAQDSTSIPLTRFQPTDLRILSYNVLFCGIAARARQSYFERIIKSLNPDILALQEMSSREINTARSNIATWLNDDNFTAVGLSGANALVSRYPILISSASTCRLSSGLNARCVLITSNFVPNSASVSSKITEHLPESIN